MHRSFRTALLHASILAAVAVPTFLLGSPTARAADVTPAQAAALETQIKDAINNLLGTKVADSVVKLTAAGDHYDITAPTMYRSITGDKPINATGTARQLADGAWSIDNLKLDSPFRMTINVPKPSDTDPKAPPTTVPMTYTVDLKGQDTHIIWDPSFTKPSTAVSALQSMLFHVDGGPMAQDVSVGPSTSKTTLRPAGPDRVDVLLDGSLQDYRVKAGTADTPVEMLMKRVVVTSALDGVSRSRAFTIVQAIASVLTGNTLPTTPGATTPVPRPTPELVKLLLAALQDFASDFSLDETLDGMTINTQGMNIGIEQSRLGLTAKSVGGMLDGGMDLGMQGLTLPDLPLGDMAVLIPKRVALHPSVSGLAVADLMRLATTASEKRDPSPDDIAALFSHGGITGGIDSMTIDVAGAVFTGQGKLTATAPSPDAMTGTAHIEAAGLDQLIQKMSSMPAMAQVLPVLALAKGLGKVVDNHVVWDLSYKGGKVLVNNVDLTAMGGATAPPPAAVPPPALQSRPAPGPSAGVIEGPRKKPTPNQVPSWGR